MKIVFTRKLQNNEVDVWKHPQKEFHEVYYQFDHVSYFTNHLYYRNLSISLALKICYVHCVFVTYSKTLDFSEIWEKKHLIFILLPFAITKALLNIIRFSFQEMLHPLWFIFMKWVTLIHMVITLFWKTNLP